MFVSVGCRAAGNIERTACGNMEGSVNPCIHPAGRMGAPPEKAKRSGEQDVTGEGHEERAAIGLHGLLLLLRCGGERQSRHLLKPGDCGLVFGERLQVLLFEAKDFEIGSQQAAGNPAGCSDMPRGPPAIRCAPAG